MGKTVKENKENGKNNGEKSRKWKGQVRKIKKREGQ